MRKLGANKCLEIFGNAIAIILAMIVFLSAGCSETQQDRAKQQDESSQVSNASVDEGLVRKVITDQFEAIFEKDAAKFIGSYSEDYDNGSIAFDGLVASVMNAMEADFQAQNFMIEFLKSGEDDSIVYIDEAGGFATTFAYTYWEQKLEDEEMGVAVEKLGAFLLHKEHGAWRIVSDKSVRLQKKADARNLINAIPFRPYQDPSTFGWPPE